VLTHGEAHHALHVVRIRRGEQVFILNGCGGEFLCEVEAAGRADLQLRILDNRCSPAPPHQLTLLQALPKGKLIESIIQKATELGVFRIVPLLAERATIRVDEESSLQKAVKWQQVAVEAIKQSGALWLPRVERPVTPFEYLGRRETFDLALIASLQPGARHAREHFRTFHARHGRKPATIAAWIGPEGDFTAAEVAAAEATGVLSISLGPLVLKVETAAVYSLSVIQHELRSDLV
jgi:16S rRNA (uracil1498-N3)-methyltransferase